jgi:hypothetical protein
LLLLTALLAAACGDAAKGPSPARAAVPAAAPVPGGDPVSEAAASYRVSATVDPGRVDVGGTARLTVAIAMTRPDVHVQREFPLRITLRPSLGVKVARDALGHADAVEPAAAGRRWDVPVSATASGAQSVNVALRFAICREAEPAWCVTRSESIDAPLVVR